MGHVQIGGKNVAGDGDKVDIQIGQVGGAKPAKGEKQKGADSVENVRSGNARVGRQVDEVHGDVVFHKGGKR